MRTRWTLSLSLRKSQSLSLSLSLDLGLSLSQNLRLRLHLRLSLRLSLSLHQPRASHGSHDSPGRHRGGGELCRSQGGACCPSSSPSAGVARLEELAQTLLLTLS